MKKLLLIITIFVSLLFSSCVEKFEGDVGVVQNVELQHGYNGKEPKYKYCVEVRHSSSNCDRYYFYTNVLYNPGDSIIMAKK